VVACVVDARRAARASASRAVPGSSPLNAEFDVSLDIQGPTGTRVRITDDLGPGILRLPAEDDTAADASPEEGVWMTLAGHADRAAYRARMVQRGDRVFGDIHLRVQAPWRLVDVPFRLPRQDSVRVQPGIEQVRAGGSLMLNRQSRREGVRRLRKFGDGTEFESLREYAIGDDPRTIDWKASARRQGHLVRNFQAERSQTVVLAIDAGRLMREWIHDRERLDHALAASLVLAQRARDFGDRVGVLVFDREVRLVQPAERVRVGRLADLLAGVRSRAEEPNYPLAFAALQRSFRKRSLVVLFSDLVDGNASRPLVNSMLSARRRHLPLMVALRNPEVEALAERPAADEAGVHARAAAEELLDARARALLGLQRGGVQVVDALPGATVQATLDRYMEIKERGLL